jgi:DNA-binding HxlR family transcriptional regulator
MVEKRRYHFNVGEVKSGIIELILGHKRRIGEPFIRSSLQEKYDGIDQGTINRHLHDLHKLGCLDLTPPSKETTRSNRWSITTLKQLENIRQYFSDIQLNRYEKSLDVVSRYHLRYISPALYMLFRVQLLLSTSFFDLCIKNDTETFYAKASEIFLFGKGFEDDLLIQSYIDDIYAKLTNTIFKNTTYLLSIWNTHIHNSLKSNIQLDPSKYLQTF